MGRGIGYYAPGLLAVFLLLLTLTPFRFPFINGACLAAFTTCIYFWTLFRPAQMPISLVFVLGVIYDVANGLPPGCTTFAWLLMCGIVSRYNRMFAIGAFWGIWAGYALSFGLATLAQWGLLSYYHGHMQPLRSVVEFWGLASLGYPLLHRLFSMSLRVGHTRRQFR